MIFGRKATRLPLPRTALMCFVGKNEDNPDAEELDGLLDGSGGDPLGDSVAKAFDEQVSADTAEDGGGEVSDAPSGNDPEASPDADDPAPAVDADAESSDADADAAAGASEPPTHWSPEDQDTFRKQTPEAQKFLLRRHTDMEADYQRKSQEIAPLRAQHDKWSQYCAQNGGDVAKAFENLMETEYVLRTGTPQAKLQMLQHVANVYKIPLGAPAAVDDSADPDSENYDPIANHPVIRQLLDGTNKISTHLESQAQRVQREGVNSGQQAIEAFKAAKGEDGKPSHPYVDEVLTDMVRLANGEKAMGRTPVLSQLYEQAVWANPTTRAKMLSADKAKADKAEADRKRAAAEKARSAGGSVSGTPSSAPAKPKSLDEAVEAAYDLAAAS